MHFLQSLIWREIKNELGNKTYDFEGGWFQTTKVPLINKKIGYIPRVDITQLNWESLYTAAKEANCVYVTIDPSNLREVYKLSTINYKLSKGRPIHLQDNIVIDLTKSEDELLKNIDKKNRYNIRVGEKSGLETRFGNTKEDFETFLKIYLDTKSRQKFFGRDENYLRKVWEKLVEFEKKNNKQYKVIATTYLNLQPLVSCFLFLYEDTVYYTYAGSLNLVRKLNPTYFTIWEILKWAKSNGYSKFDFWGVEKDLTSGFSLFKSKFGGELIHYEDSVNLIIDKKWYFILNILQKLREKFSFLKKV
jgi:lipid II:glycine glycyltransferase (peptidoglycan interpeptide bridge formation enzyme)